MRVRRIRSGGVPLRSIPSTSTIFYPTLHHEAAKSQTPVPLTSHTMHPESQRWELGLAKYSTGPFAVPKAFRKQTELSNIGLKIYSTALVQRQSIKQALLSAFKNSTKSDNLSSYLRQAWEISYKIRSISEKIVDAFFQIFGNPKAKNAGFRSLGRRQWNLSLRLHRYRDQGKLSSRPFVFLNTVGIKTGRRCDFQGKPFGPCSVSFALRFHLRTHVGSTTADETKSTNLRTESHHDTFQELVDNLLAEQLKAMKEKTSIDAEHLVSNVSNALLRNLVASPLASLVDFRHLEVVATNLNRRERVVLNTLLNDDGTAPNDAISQGPGQLQNRSLPLPGDRSRGAMANAVQAQDDSISASSEVVVSLRKGRQSVSQTVQDKFGFNVIDTNYESKGAMAPPHSLSNLADAVFDRFEKLCGEVPENGIVGLARVATLFAREFPDHLVKLDSRPMPVDVDADLHTSSDARHAFAGIYIKNGTGTVRVTLPLLACPNATMHWNNEGDLSIRHCKVSLFGRCNHEHTAETSDKEVPQLSTKEEIQVLSQMASTVLSGICKEVTFNSVEEVPTLLADGILRLVQFADPRLHLGEVQIRVSLGEDSPVGRSDLIATRTRGDDRASIPNHATQQIDNAATHTFSTEVSRTDGDSTGTNVAMLVDRHKNDLTPTQPQVFVGSTLEHHTTTEPTESKAEQTSYGLRVLELRGNDQRAFGTVAASPAIERKFGIRKCTFKMQLLQEQNATQFPKASDPSDIVSRLEEAMMFVQSTGLAGIRKAFKRVALDTANIDISHFIATQTSDTIPEDMKGLIERNSNCTVQFNIGSNDTDNPEERKVSILTPGILFETFSLGLIERGPGQKISFRLQLNGTLCSNEDEELEGNLNLASTMIRMWRRFHSTVSAMLSCTKCDGLQDLTHRIVSRLMERRDLFSDILTVEHIELHGCVKTGVDSQLRVLERSESSAIVPPSQTRDQVQDQHSVPADGEQTLHRTVFLALGSNVGNRLQNIENACSEIDSDPNMRVTRTSALYETVPMYYKDQDQFLNGVCEVETTLKPLDLLDRLQSIEQDLGRVKTIDKGPRNIDLDILIYRNEIVNNERLTIPHPLMQEREFVLRPLCDIAVGRDRRIVATKTRARDLLRELPESSQPMRAVSYLGPGQRNIRVNDPQGRTRLMSIVNVTPDSFSDGGVHEPTNKETLASLIRAQLEAGTTIVDIGGQSSRPNAPDVTAEEEIARIVPAIEVVKSMPEAESVTISVDTYRATVAEAAIKVGAHVINDISAGKLDPDMLPTIAKLGCTYVMMHMRGTPATMMSEENCTYSEGLIKTIENELFERVEAAQEAGVRRWRIILDPGIGFSKTAEHNVELLRHFSQLKNCSRLRNFAWLVGSSRKSFIGKLTGVEDPKSRGWGTAATVTAAIQGGADIVRVHDAREMNAVVKMADAMYRY